MMSGVQGGLMTEMQRAFFGGDVFVGMDGGGEWTFARANTDASAEVRSLASGTGQNRRVSDKQ
jgi:hypothetical protein